MFDYLSLLVYHVELNERKLVRDGYMDVSLMSAKEHKLANPSWMVILA